MAEQLHGTRIGNAGSKRYRWIIIPLAILCWMPVIAWWLR